MIAVNVILIVSIAICQHLTNQAFSIQEFATFKGDETQDFHLVPIIAVCVAWGKF
jgi:hypothetical protein